MKRPNLLLITTDQQNAEIMACAGNPVVRTPHLDRLAREGALFAEAYTPHPVCTPARTSILTGQTAARHGVGYNIHLREDRPDPPHWTGLAAEALPFPELLRRQGYRTALFGKLHTKQAGDRNFGFQTLRLAEGKGQFVEFGTAPDHYRAHLRQKGYPDSAWRTWEAPGYPERGWTPSPLPVEDYIDTWTATEALRWLGDGDGPFFAWVSFSGPHTPWDPPAPYDRMYDPDQIPEPARREGELEEKHPDWVDCIAQTVPATPPFSRDNRRQPGIANAYRRFSDRQRREMLAAYYGQISLIDAQVGRLLEHLDERGLGEDTLVIFTTDHGDYLGNNWAFFKYGAQYDSLSRIPFLLRWPARVPPGARCASIVSLVDIAPTMLDAAGIEGVDPMDGTSLLPLLAGRSEGWREHLVLEGKPRCAVTADWKYLLWPDGFAELYDRRADPHELHNRSHDPELASIQAAMHARLRPG